METRQFGIIVASLLTALVLVVALAFILDEPMEPRRGPYKYYYVSFENEGNATSQLIVPIPIAEDGDVSSVFDACSFSLWHGGTLNYSLMDTVYGPAVSMTCSGSGWVWFQNYKYEPGPIALSMRNGTGGLPDPGSVWIFCNSTDPVNLSLHSETVFLHGEDVHSVFTETVEIHTMDQGWYTAPLIIEHEYV
ncbi:MAG: hypothetical protein L0Z54_03250 [Thermoplasmata archaeon]|nr:hypothetical protein [Thermoplasmata archaeon]